MARQTEQGKRPNSYCYHSPGWRVFCGLLLIGLATSLSGCLPARPDAEKPPQQIQPIVLSFWTMQLGAFSHVINPMLRGFEASHPGVRVQWVDVPFTEMEKRVLIGVLGNQPPDVVNLNPTFSALLAQRGALVDMGHTVPSAVQQPYLPVAWDAVTLKPSGQSKEQSDQPPVRFGLPWYLTTALTYWNTRQLPVSPVGWKQLITLRPQSGYVALPAVTEHGAIVRWLAKQGVTPCDPAAAQWLGLLRQGLVTHVLSPDMITATHRTALEQFQQGKLGMLVAGSSVLGMLAENAPEQLPTIRLAPQFGARPDVVDVATMLVAVPKNSPNQSLAVELALWITNSQNQLVLARAAPVLPSIQPALDAVTRLPITLKDKPVNNPILKHLLAQARSLSVNQLKQAKTGMPVLSNQAAVNDKADAVTQAVLLGQQTPTAAMQQLCDTLKAE